MSLDAQSGADRPQSLPWIARYALAVFLTAVTTLAAVLFDKFTPTPNLSLLFVLPVVIAAASFGFGPSLMSAVLGALAFNYFLLAPRYTLSIADRENTWALVLLLIVAAIVSAVAAQARRRADEALRSADQAAALRALARSLVAATDRTAIAESATLALTRVFNAPSVLLLEAAGELVASPPGAPSALSEADIEGARWALASRLPTKAGEYPVAGAVFDFWPVVSAQRQCAVIGVRLADFNDGRPDNVDRLIDTVASYVAVALDREHFASRAVETQVQMASQRLKGDLLAAVSHDLKTPLATILFSLQSLQRFHGEHGAEARAELLLLAEKETERLGGMVSNLLDMGRIDADAVPVRTQPTHAAELVAGALEQAAQALAGHAVERDASGGRVLLADPQLAETALANLLQNAGKHTPADCAIRVRVGGDGEDGWIEVEDDGPGFPEPIEPLFEKFTRGVDGDGRAPGTGLGLAIARGFAEAQGGRVEAFNRASGGATVRLILPLAERQ
jgi:two-component system sensor histidine kinase KdpD